MDHKENKEKQIHKCAECAYAELHQWRNNPVIAQCLCNPKAPRQVAYSLIRCALFVPRSNSTSPPVIIKHNGYG